MTDLLAFITWDVNPNVIESPIMVRYYGLLWAMSFFVGLYLMKKMMNNDKAPEAFTDKIFLYVMIGSVLGARLGHVVFYQPDYYFTAAHWMEIPKIWEGGLASHGGLIGVVLALWLYSVRVSKRSFFWAGDKVVITVAIAASLIRVGNLMNSEIIGIRSDSSIALFFQYEAKQNVISQIRGISDGNLQVSQIEITPSGSDSQGPIGMLKVNVVSQGALNQNYLTQVADGLKSNLKNGYNHREDHLKFSNDKTGYLSVNNNTGAFGFEVYIVPRIPAQIWEAFAYLLIFGIMMYGYWIKHWYKKEGMLFGLFLILLFGARFIIEFWKEHQTLADDAVLNMGQWLSIPPVLVGLGIVIWAAKRPDVDTSVDIETKTTDK